MIDSYMSIAKRRSENFGRKGISSNGIWICVATATTWRVPAVRSRREQLKPERLGRRRCRDEMMERRARLMMTNEVVASIRDRPRVVSRQTGTMVPGRADNDRRALPASYYALKYKKLMQVPEQRCGMLVFPCRKHETCGSIENWL